MLIDGTPEGAEAPVSLCGQVGPKLLPRKCSRVLPLMDADARFADPAVAHRILRNLEVCSGLTRERCVKTRRRVPFRLEDFVVDSAILACPHPSGEERSYSAPLYVDWVSHWRGVLVSSGKGRSGSLFEPLH